jgi:hypothetical protein
VTLTGGKYDELIVSSEQAQALAETLHARMVAVA